MENMEVEVQRTTQDLLEENASLKTQIQNLERAVVNLVEKNTSLAEFIRLKMTDILTLAKEFRDEYSSYAEFVKLMTEVTSDDITKELPFQLGKPES